MKDILADDMEHELRIRETLRIIAAAEPTLSASALDATKKSGAVLQARFNEIAEAALKGTGLKDADRRKAVALVRYSEPDSFDAMLRVRMSKDQLATELPERAKRAGFGEVSRYVRWVLFGSGEPEAVSVQSVSVAEPVDNWNDAISAAIDAAKALGGRPRLDSVLKALEELKR